MCFTNTLYTDLSKLSKAYRLSEGSGNSFQPVRVASGFDYPEWPILTTHEPEHFSSGKWGLIPAWVKENQQALRLRSTTLNARAETIFEKPSYKTASLQNQRCIIPSTGFFEWQTVGKKKYPYFITLKNDEFLSMAGLWEKWIDENGESNITFTIITVPANPLMEKIHNSKMRMPAILMNENIGKWLDTSTPVPEIIKMLAPIDDSHMKAHTVRPIKMSNNYTGFDELTSPHEYPELSRQYTLF